MNAGYFVNKGIQALLKKYGVKGATREIAAKIGASLAAQVVNAIVAGRVTMAMGALGGKVGALAGVFGVAAGALLGAL